ncbi:4-hydroxy-3-methylbut-2-enyl diphosphate reductase [Helicobacter sp. MIT 05-5293]|uniref:4-hydroxy-3-methylbut-2-enyl diphosphate reductase n=1 Tax=uncultured Helicobacter sp. TaxID=175537 RepID=A0A650EJH9_9HELI|nr:4-hydroxy-3-methylbut-2-enyl diphosphate reductase [Helicobacter sp. MIT 05-5293]QGT49887.1 4-hydroxy-3-methylbut-2-enyl diphosphate reductase [uncultured Helicobacter sp.]TLD81891.1 4-hydroxy-3-methylbut-2-enyl diphosphate reductase [Helicobacter sp. MIT 05-5293]
MNIKFAEKYGFCFGVKRAIQIAERNRNATTLGPIIHNTREIARLERDFDVSLSEDIENLADAQNVIIRTHGITKQDLQTLQERKKHIIDATCPFVTKPQKIVKKMSDEHYQIIIFGDKIHPEVKGVASYGENVCVITSVEELEKVKLEKKVALVSQTTKQPKQFEQIAAYLVSKVNECRVFNTICNATFDNQHAADMLSRDVDVMIVVGGKNSSNTKQLLAIVQKHCPHSYLVEDENDLQESWFEGKALCGITAGASTPDWIIKRVQEKIEQI